jgi:hypothetical protein
LGALPEALRRGQYSGEIAQRLAGAPVGYNAVLHFKGRHG